MFREISENLLIPRRKIVLTVPGSVCGHHTGKDYISERLAETNPIRGAQAPSPPEPRTTEPVPAWLFPLIPLAWPGSRLVGQRRCPHGVYGTAGSPETLPKGASCVSPPTRVTRL
jgi:hypothetical protein